MESVLTEAPTVEPQPEQEKGTILVVDDSPIDARLAGGVLRKALGLNVIFAADGIEALEAIQLQRPTAVLTDLMMPRMDGLELVHEVCKRFPHMPVVLMTATGSEQVATQALQSGAAGYVPKLVLHEQLPAVMERVIGVSRTERRRRQFLQGLDQLDCSLSLVSDVALVPVFVGYVQEHLAGVGLCDANGRIRVGVALEEAMINGMHHGNLELSSTLKEGDRNEYTRLAQERLQLSPYRNRRLHVRVRINPREAVFVLRDEGPGFDVSTLPDPTDPENLLRPSGRGLLLVRTFMDEVKHNDRGNEITLLYRRKARTRLSSAG